MNIYEVEESFIQKNRKPSKLLHSQEVYFAIRQKVTSRDTKYV